jgi:hypothetical protein
VVVRSERFARLLILRIFYMDASCLLFCDLSCFINSRKTIFCLLWFVWSSEKRIYIPFMVICLIFYLFSCFGVFSIGMILLLWNRPQIFTEPVETIAGVFNNFSLLQQYIRELVHSFSCANYIVHPCANYC